MLWWTPAGDGQRGSSPRRSPVRTQGGTIREMLYLDCFSGASGDMVLGALLDLGLPLDALRSALGSLALEYGDIGAEKVTRAGVTATKFRLHENPKSAVSPQQGHPHFHLKG